MVRQENPRAKFILETNGLMLGYREGLAERLIFRGLLARIAIKGVDPASFEKISGARREFFPYPLLAIKNLESRGISTWPALMEAFFNKAEIDELKKTLQEN